MKIIPENMLNANKEILRKPAQSKEAPVSGAAAKPSGYDTITIAANPNTGVTDEQYIAQLKKNILSDINSGATAHKLTDLRQQIALGDYDVNVPDIVRKIMQDNPEASYE